MNGALALSRALGDFEYKNNSAKKPHDQAVTAFPDVSITKMTADIEFIIVACDGLWDVLSSEEAIEWTHKNIYDNAFKKGKITDNALKEGT